MDRDKLESAILEAHRFIIRAQETQQGFEFHKFSKIEGGFWKHNDTRKTAATKRASMDLTRALADLRKPS